MEPKIDIREASWEEATELKNAMFSALSQRGVDLSGVDLAKLMESEAGDAISVMANAFFTIDSDARFNSALMRCMARCSYNGQPISGTTFDDVSARKYYYKIAIGCIKENIVPLFGSLFSMFQALVPQAEESPKS